MKRKFFVYKVKICITSVEYKSCDFLYMGDKNS